MKKLDIHQLRNEREQLISELLKNCLVFFAFSDKQFAENKTELQEGEKYVSLLNGGYCPKSMAEPFINGMEQIGQWFKDQIAEHGLRKQLISYELGNHEAWYVYDIEDTMYALGEGFTEEEVWEVFNEGLKFQEV